MYTFKEYADSFVIDLHPGIMDFCLTDFEYCIFCGSKPLLTPGGNHFSHPSENMIRLIITDLQLFGSSVPKEFSSPVMFSFSRDILITGEDPFHREWENQLASDLFVLIKTSGKSTIQPFVPDDPLFEFSFISLTGLIENINEFTTGVMGEISMEESDSHPFPNILKVSYERLSVEQKVAVQALSSVHRSGIVLPLLLISGEINPVEYVNGLISLKIQPKELFTELLAGVARVQTFSGYLLHKQLYKKQISEMIREGEGDFIEFKSTLRWDIRAGKTNPAIERACLKTISAFLNSSGGVLLIGIRDDGSIEGIETDKFANEDKFLLHLWTLIRTCLGRDFSPYIHTKVEKMEEKTICVVDCLPSNRPVFLHQPGFDEEMYIRLGPSSNAMDISEALKYIDDHFKKLS